MAAKRISALAKELGVDSKAIVAKCHAEGISPDVVKGHMSTVSAGLEASIRDWFSSGGSTTAVETAQKVDIDQVRKKAPVRRKGTKKGDEDHVEHDPLHASEPEPVLIAPPAPAPSLAPHPEPQAPAPLTPPTPPAPAHKPEPLSLAPTPVEPPPAPHTRATPIVGTPPAEPVKLAPTRTHAPLAHTAEAAGTAVEAKPTRAPEPPKPDQAPPPAARPAAVAPTKLVAPAPMNVPQRPTGVTPAGPRLQAPATVRLSGPKVVRVEAPEQLAPPRPRRYGPSSGAPSGPTGPRVGGGAGGPGGPGAPGGADDDRGRSPRRKQEPARRSTGQGVPARRRASAGGEDWVGGQVFSEQDLIEREARLARSGGFLKKRKQELSRPGQVADAADASGRTRISAPFTIKDLSETTGVKAAEIVKKLFLQGIMKKINDPIAADKAVEIMMDFDIDLEVVEARTAEETVSDQFLTRDMKDARPRGAVVTILGHVDHGKTSLLDKIRNANVAAGEAGGITQKTSAFVAEVVVEGQPRPVVFLDTPGHEAFTSMRARGARMTDVVVLVVSAPEGVMPQTIESINHAKAAKVPLVVALNKIDRPDATEAQIQKTLGELAKAGINPVEWGGETEVVRVSAVTGQGITQLLETLDYQAQLLDLKADYDGQAQGTVIEAKTEEGRGAVANILVQQGRLKVGDFIVMGRAFGRVRDMTDDKGTRIKEALPPMPVQVSGIDLVCDAGDKFFVTRSLREAEDAADQRRHRERETQLAQPKLTLDSLFSQMQTTESETKEIRIILKTDQQGTVDVLKSECEKVKSAEIRTRVIHAAVGGIQESDVTLADASKAIIIGFNVIPSGKARALAEHEGVEIRTYQVIYDITDDLKKAAEGMLAPELREEVLGHAEVRAVFRISKVGSIAGCYVTDGTVQRDALIRVTRNGIVIEHDRKLAQLRRVKDDVKEVRAGTECGMKIDGYDDIKEGDVLECYKKIEVKRTL